MAVKSTGMRESFVAKMYAGVNKKQGRREVGASLTDDDRTSQSAPLPGELHTRIT